MPSSIAFSPCSGASLTANDPMTNGTSLIRSELRPSAPRNLLWQFGVSARQPRSGPKGGTAAIPRRRHARHPGPMEHNILARVAGGGMARTASTKGRAVWQKRGELDLPGSPDIRAKYEPSSSFSLPVFQFKRASIFSAARIAMAMIVICGLTEGGVGTVLPSTM